MSDKILISIINYRTGALSIDAAASALTALGDRDGTVAVVDNASGDGSADQIAAWIAGQDDPRVTLIRSATNSGFSGGHNQGMAAEPDAAHFLLVNSDALLRKDFFDHLMPTVQALPKTGLFAPQLEWDDGTPQISCFRFASPTSELIRGAETGPVTKLFQGRVTALELPPDPDQMEWASFACILLRGDMVRALGPMDEGYFLYFEDAEYGMRARRAGWGVHYEPKARAVHFRGGSGPVKKIQAAKKRLPPYYWRSRTRFLRQGYGVTGPLRGNLAWMLGRAIARLRMLTGRGVPKSHDREWRDIWMGFFDPLRPDKAPKG